MQQCAVSSASSSAVKSAVCTMNGVGKFYTKILSHNYQQNIQKVPYSSNFRDFGLKQIIHDADAIIVLVCVTVLNSSSPHMQMVEETT